MKFKIMSGREKYLGKFLSSFVARKVGTLVVEFILLGSTSMQLQKLCATEAIFIIIIIFAGHSDSTQPYDTIFSWQQHFPHNRSG